MSKVLIQLANGTPFADAVLEPLNSYILKQQPRVNEWLIRFGTSQSKAGPPATEELEADVELANQQYEYYASLEPRITMI